MAPDDSDTSEGMKKSLRDYWLQYYRQKKFILPEELEKDSGKTLEEMGLSQSDFKIKDSSIGVQASDFEVDEKYSESKGFTNGNGLTNGKVRWYVNDGTPDDGWTTNNIASSINKPSSVFVADIDNDGNLDVVSSAYNDDEIAWYESTAIPEFSNIMMPIVSVLAVVGFNYRRRY